MKSYKERLPLIDEAIDELSGELPILGSVSADKLLLCITATVRAKEGSYVRGYSSRPNGNYWMFICTTEEFEQRVKELNSMKKYEYMKEYHCKLNKPQLPDDTRIDILEDNAWMGERKFEDVYWQRAVKFRIVDERWKPENKKDWYEKGELPPVGEVVKGYVLDNENTWRWQDVEILKHGGELRHECAVLAIKIKSLRWCAQFKPLRTEEDELVERALSDCPYPGSESTKVDVKALIKAGWRPTGGNNE